MFEMEGFSLCILAGDKGQRRIPTVTHHLPNVSMYFETDQELNIKGKWVLFGVLPPLGHHMRTLALT